MIITLSRLVCVLITLYPFCEKQPSISIEQFFQMTGIRFMDELTVPRWSMHQASLQGRAVEDIPLTEYVKAMTIDIPQLVLYSRVSKDLQAWIEKSKIVYAQMEEEAAKITPELFTEYLRADEEGQAELLVSCFGCCALDNTDTFAIAPVEFNQDQYKRVG